MAGMATRGETKQTRLPSIDWRRVATTTRSLLLALTLIVGVLAGVRYLSQLDMSNRFAITKVVAISGAQHTDERALNSVLANTPERGFFTIDIEALRDNIEALPWIKKVALRRVWPDEIQLQVTEHVAAAQFNDSALLSTEGEIFMPVDAEQYSSLPRVVAQDYQAELVSEMLPELRNTLAAVDVDLRELQISPRGAWKLRFADDSWLLLGKNSQEQRLKRFLKFFPTIRAERNADIAYIDLRYGTGMAVQWKEMPGASADVIVAKQ